MMRFIATTSVSSGPGLLAAVRSGPGPGRTAGVGGDRGLNLDIHVHEDGELPVQVTDQDRLWTGLGTRPREDWRADSSSGFPRETASAGRSACTRATRASRRTAGAAGPAAGAQLFDQPRIAPWDR